MDCTIIIPVGPGHETLSQQALESVISVQDLGKFTRLSVVVGDDTKGERGRSATRNAMVAGPDPSMAVFTTGETNEGAFQSEWLFFLDADDLLCSPFTYGDSAFAVASPYLDDYDCIWGNILELHPNGDVMRRSQVGRITTYKAFIKTPAMLGCQMGHFVRREAFERIGGFDESLDVCEDVDLYLREWSQLRCIKQESPLFLNRRGAHSWTLKKDKSGRPVHTGREWSMRAAEMLKKARKEWEKADGQSSH